MVEGVFFRAVLLERLAACLREGLSGGTLMAFMFGLAHAPGYVLRGAGAVEAIGATPSFNSIFFFTIIAFYKPRLFCERLIEISLNLRVSFQFC